MKGLAFSTMAIFTGLTILGVLFKVMHWPGANIGLVLGICGLAFFAVPVFTFYKYKTSN